MKRLPGTTNIFLSREGNAFKLEKESLVEVTWFYSCNKNKHNTIRYKCILVGKPINQISVHRAMAMCYLQFDKKKVVNHLNGNTLDNRVENLEMVSHKENSVHAIKTGLKLLKIDDMKLRFIRHLIIEGANVKELSERFNVTGTVIRGIKSGKKYCWEI